MFFSFPEDARWNPDRHAVEFGVAVGSTRAWYAFLASYSGGLLTAP